MKAINVSASVGKPASPGTTYHDVDVTIVRTRKGKWTVEILDTWGDCRGYREEHGRKKVIGRGDDLDDAIADGRQRAENASIEKGYMEEAISEAEDKAVSEADAADAAEVPAGSLAELHISGKTNYSVVTEGGLAYFAVSPGDTIGGYKATILTLCTADGWKPFERDGKQYIPTYAYDRLIVAGLTK